MTMRPSRVPRRGRPLKFGRPARSVTVTLPDDVLAALRARDRDLGRAIVSLLPRGAAARPPAVVLHQTGRRAVIVVRPIDALRRLPGVELVSLGDPERALIAFTGGLSVPAFELAVQDLLEAGARDPDTVEVIGQLAAVLRETRRTAGRSLSEATIMVLADAAHPRVGGSVASRRPHVKRTRESRRASRSRKPAGQ